MRRIVVPVLSMVAASFANVEAYASTAQEIEARERMQATHTPGVSIAVLNDGRIEWARGFGVTAIGGSPVTPLTLFQAASISKPVSALSVMQLVDRGKLDLDTDVNKYLKSWQLPANEFTAQQKVTLRGLLAQYSAKQYGVARSCSFRDIQRGQLRGRRCL